MKRWANIVLAVAVLLIAAVAAIPFFVHPDTLRPVLETQLSAALGRQVKLGSLSFSLFRGSLVANNLSIADDPAYGAAPFLSARKFRIGINMWPLIRSRRIQVRSFEIEAPQIHLVRGADGRWNFSSLSRNEAGFAADPAYSAALAHSSVGLIAIRDGRAVVDSLPAQGQPHIYDHVNLSLRQFSVARQFPFALSTTVPGDGTLAVNGNIGPIDAQNAAMTPLDVHIVVHHLDPVAAGFLDSDVGISMSADMDVHAMSNGKIISSIGSVRMQRLQLVPSGAPASQAIYLNYDITHNLQESTGRLQDASIQLGTGRFNLNGLYQLAEGDPWVDLKVTGQSVPIDELRPLMTAAGVKLPNGSQLKGGMLIVALEMIGPAKHLVITGPVELDHTQLTGFDLGSKISGIAALGGIKTGDTTQIQSLKFNLQVSDAGIKVGQVDSVMPAMGESLGSGTISPAGVLAFHLVAHVTTAHGMQKMGVGLLTKLNKFSSSSATKASDEGVPMLVTGTAANPVITADVSGLLRRDASTLLGNAKKHSPGNVFRRLFRKKNDSSTTPQ